ncbi:MAG: hypothetical protein JSV20_00795, partial [Candidatus Bathyarchaeota archaeon]
MERKRREKPRLQHACKIFKTGTFLLHQVQNLRKNVPISWSKTREKSANKFATNLQQDCTCMYNFAAIKYNFAAIKYNFAAIKYNFAAIKY